MKGQIPYLHQRRNTFYFRRRIPARFRALAGCTEWKLVLERARRSQILLEVKVLTEATDAAIADLRRNQPVSPTLLHDALQELYPERRSLNQLSLDDAGKRYAESKGLAHLNKAEQTAVEQFREFAGDVALGQIGRRTVREWIAWLRSARDQSPATIRRRLGSMSAIFTGLTDLEDEYALNPFARHKLHGVQSGYRLPFHKSHLQIISRWFAGPSGQRPSGQIIRLLRMTGARPLEVGGLMAEDIRLSAPTPFMMIQPNPLRGLKTQNSQRIIPLVGDGLAAARELGACSGAGALFPPTCWDTNSLSARLNKALRAAGVPKSKYLTAYSFRHTLEEALRISGAPFDVQQAILGHAKRSTTERYGARRVSLERMKSALEIAIESLGDVDEANFEPLIANHDE